MVLMLIVLGSAGEIVVVVVAEPSMPTTIGIDKVD